MKNVFLIIFIISFCESFGQNKPTKVPVSTAVKSNSIFSNAVTSTELNLFNSKDFNTVEKDKLYRPKDYKYILQEGYVLDKLTYLGNNYYHLTGVNVGDVDQNYLLKNKNGNLTVISDAVRQMLNDSLIILDSGKIFNLFEDKFIESKGTDKFLRILKSNDGNRLYLSTEGLGVNSQNFRSFEPIKSDIIKVGKWKYGGPVGNGSIFNKKEVAERGDDFISYSISEFAELNNELYYNIILDSFLNFEYLNFESNNNTSKYILFQKESSNYEDGRFYLINRYDVNDFKVLFGGKDWNFKPYRSGMGSAPPIIYNDSLLIFAQNVDASNHSRFPFNKEINIDFNQYYSKENWEFPIYQSDWNEVNFFMKKYNGGAEVTKTDKIQFNQLKSIYNNLIEENPAVIIIYNYKTNKVVSVIDRIGKSFSNISSILIDKSNQTLVVNDNYPSITLFDLKSYNQIVSFRAIVNNIDKDNNLTYNLKSKEIAASKDKNNIDKNLSYFFTNLNKFNLANNYTSNFKYPNYNLNEFTTKDEFEKINFMIDSVEKVNFLNQTPNPLSSTVSNSINIKSEWPDNNSITSKLKNLYEDWYSNFEKIKKENPLNNREFVVAFDYVNYNLDDDKIQLKSTEYYNKPTFDSLDIEDIRIRTNSTEELQRDFQKIPSVSKVEYLSFDYEKENDKYYYTLDITGIGVENAKKLKEKTLSIKIKIKINPEYVNEKISPFERAIVKRKFNSMKPYFSTMRGYEARYTSLLYSYFLNSGYEINKEYKLNINNDSIKVKESSGYKYVFEVDTN